MSIAKSIAEGDYTSAENELNDSLSELRNDALDTIKDIVSETLYEGVIDLSESIGTELLNFKPYIKHVDGSVPGKVMAIVYGGARYNLEEAVKTNDILSKALISIDESDETKTVFVFSAEKGI